MGLHLYGTEHKGREPKALVCFFCVLRFLALVLSRFLSLTHTQSLIFWLALVHNRACCWLGSFDERMPLGALTRLTGRPSRVCLALARGLVF